MPFLVGDVACGRIPILDLAVVSRSGTLTQAQRVIWVAAQHGAQFGGGLTIVPEQGISCSLPARMTNAYAGVLLVVLDVVEQRVVSAVVAKSEF